ncbi:MAG: signal peptide peptidase SppA [Tannerellaceae bacterium]|nr:signal peptide peptidase SppA [Tannerellaceae bacterium]
MKQFFKMMFASTLGALVAMGLAIIILVFIGIGMAASMGRAESSPFVPKPNTVYKLSLNGAILENVEENPFAALFGEGSELGLSLKDIVRTIRLAKNDKNVSGIYLKAGTLFSAGVATIDVIRRELIDFKGDGKFVIAYADNYTQGSYYLCSAADKVFMNPMGLLLFTGRSAQYEFYKGLGDKLGVEFMVFKAGTYKGAVEPFMLDKLSDENREQITSYQGEMWTHIMKNVADSRGITVDAINTFVDKAGFIGGQEMAVEAGLIDSLKYETEVETYIKDQAEQSDKRLRVVGIDKMNRMKEERNKSKNKIAVLYAEGEIASKTAASPFLSSSGVNEDMVAALIKLKEDEDTKAVVLRVNSPGGSAYVSEQIWHEIVELKKVKPIVVSMGNVAASGGYYISAPATKIFAEPTTITGSIGVFSLLPNMAGLYQKLGITTDEVNTNKYSSFPTLTRPWRDDEKALMQAHIMRMYDTFLTRCSDGRSKTKEEIDLIGQGRVWTGKQALERGLVDELGGLDDAISAAADLAMVGEDYKIEYAASKKDFLTQILERQLVKVKVKMLEDMIGPEMLEQMQTVRHIRSQSGVQARLPYEFQEVL